MAPKKDAKKKKPLTAADKGCECIRAGELDNLEKILDENKKLINKHEAKSGKNMLHVAVEEGNLQFIDLILDYGAKVNFRSKDDQTAIMLAATLHEDEILQFLIKSKGNFLTQGKGGNTPLHFATRRGHDSTVTLLLNVIKDLVRKWADKAAEEEKQRQEDEKDSDEDEDEDRSGDEGADDDEGNGGAAAAAAAAPEAATNPAAADGAAPAAADAAAVNKAATTETTADEAEEKEEKEEEEEEEEDLDNLLGYAGMTSLEQVEIKNEMCETVLATAIKMSNFQIANQLLELGADINSISLNGNTPLTRSAFDGRLESVQFCLGHPGCDLHARNMNGETAVLISAKQKYFKVTAYLLKEHKANIEDADAQGNNALLFGAMTHSMDIVKFAVETAKCDINASNSWGTTALMYAAKRRTKPKKRDDSMLDYLLSKGADLNIQDRNFQTALMMACATDDLDRVTKLVEAGADPDIINDVGKTAIAYLPDHNIINERGNIEYHDSNVRQYKDALNVYCDNVKPSVLPPRKRPEWLDRQVEYEVIEAREIKWDKWVRQVYAETEELEKQEVKQAADDERQAALAEEEEARKKAEWDAMPEEEKEKVLRRKAKEAAVARQKFRDDAIARGEDPDVAEEVEKKKEEGRRTMINRQKKAIASSRRKTVIKE